MSANCKKQYILSFIGWYKIFSINSMKKLKYINILGIVVFVFSMVLFGCKGKDTAMNDNSLERILSDIDKTGEWIISSADRYSTTFQKMTNAGLTQADKVNIRILTAHFEEQEAVKEYMKLTNRIFKIGMNEWLSCVTNELTSFKFTFPEELEQNQDNIKKLERLRKICGIMETNLVPLIPFYESNLETNCNFVGAAYGLLALKQAGFPSLMKALTNNHSATVQAIGMRSIVKLGWRAVHDYDETIDPNIAKEVLPLILPYLEHTTDLIRRDAVLGLDVYCTSPEECVPTLLQIALTDSSNIIRVSALRRIKDVLKRFESSDPQTIEAIRLIMNDPDQQKSVRAVAEEVLKSLTDKKKKFPPAYRNGTPRTIEKGDSSTNG